MTQIRLETLIHAPREKVFDMARDVGVHEDCALGTREKAVAGVTSGLVEQGDSVTWRAKHFGVWQQLTVAVTEFDPPSMFVDEMRRGAFKSMWHLHRFDRTDGGTLMIDELKFEAPWGVLGWIAERLVLEQHMRRFLLARNECLKSKAEGSEQTLPR